jgi:hypothetical protein
VGELHFRPEALGATAIPGSLTKGDLVEDYNGIKRSHEGGDKGAYLDDKAAFFERLLPMLEP